MNCYTLSTLIPYFGHIDTLKHRIRKSKRKYQEVLASDQILKEMMLHELKLRIQKKYHFVNQKLEGGGPGYLCLIITPNNEVQIQQIRGFIHSFFMERQVIHLLFTLFPRIYVHCYNESERQKLKQKDGGICPACQALQERYFTYGCQSCPYCRHQNEGCSLPDGCKYCWV